VNEHSGISYISRIWKLVLQKKIKIRNFNHCLIARGWQEADKFHQLMHHQDGVYVSYCKVYKYRGYHLKATNEMV
jgi:hypothetical protein